MCLHPPLPPLPPPTDTLIPLILKQEISISLKFYFWSVMISINIYQRNMLEYMNNNLFILWSILFIASPNQSIHSLIVLSVHPIHCQSILVHSASASQSIHGQSILVKSIRFIDSPFCFFLVLSSPFYSFLVLSSPSQSFLLLLSPFKSFLVLSTSSQSFQVLSSPSTPSYSFLVLLF